MTPLPPPARGERPPPARAPGAAPGRRRDGDSHGRGGRGRGRDPVPANCKRRASLPPLRAVPGLRGRRPGWEPGGAARSGLRSPGPCLAVRLAAHCSPAAGRVPGARSAGRAGMGGRGRRPCWPRAGRGASGGEGRIPSSPAPRCFPGAMCACCRDSPSSRPQRESCSHAPFAKIGLGGKSTSATLSPPHGGSR